MTTASNTNMQLLSGNKLPDTSMIEGQLVSILDSLTFKRATVLSRLLEFVVRAGREGPLSERSVATSVFGQDPSFDPATDPTVRVHFGRLRRRLEAYYDSEGRFDPVKIHIPERSYTPRFEFTGLKAPMVDDPSLRTSDKNADSEGHSRERKRPAVAVLPFVNLTERPENDVLCASLTDELTSALASLPDLDVAARSSAQQFGPGPVDVRIVGKELGVDLVIEGSVKKENDMFRVTAQLVSASDGFAIWSNSVEPRHGLDGSISATEVASQLKAAIPFDPVAAH